MMRASGCLLPAAAMLMLSACSTTPTHFYTLSASPSARAAHAHKAPFVISVEPVKVPAQVDQPQLLVRVGPDEVDSMEFQRWAAPLTDEIRDALAADIAADLHSRDVYSVTPPPHTPLYRIEVAVQQFESIVDHYALIKAAWSIHPAAAKSSHITCFSREKVAVKKGFSGLVAGHQRALNEVGAAIARTLRVMRQTKRQPTCPA